MDTEAAPSGDRDATTIPRTVLERPAAVRREVRGRVRTHRPAVVEGVAENGGVEENIVRGED
ncbi:hypothetical protein [Streptomyces lavendulocolor]|uniref:hypothetical protein n=1 Tax=Streptomyces lavendulocolor TaxID=67316 RepID=UPI003C2FAC67